MNRPVVWTIAGTDPSGGAGIQADLKTMNALGTHGCSVITAVLAQNAQGVAMIEYPSRKMLAEQLRVLQEDMPPRAVKIGMLGNAHTVNAVSDALEHIDVPVVCDPVMISTSGTRLMEPGAREHIVSRLLPLVTLLTPNIPETEDLTGMRLNFPDDIERAAARLLEMGPASVLVKGGHVQSELSSDFWTDGQQKAWLTSPRQSRGNTHGSGCTLSSAVAACSAFGHPLLDALVIAKAYVNQGIRLGGPTAGGRGSLAHEGWPACPQDLPCLTTTAEHVLKREAFPDCGPAPLGMYPIVDSAKWVERLLTLGVRTIQLRIKDPDAAGLRAEALKAVDLARRHGARLFINDHWRLALELGAYGVHLGREDLEKAELPALARAGVRLGVTTYGYADLARNRSIEPSYAAFGPVFPSPTKPDLPGVLGLEGLARLCRLSPWPGVAIGGITLERARDVMAAGADGIAMISDITEAADVEARVRAWLDLFRRG